MWNSCDGSDAGIFVVDVKPDRVSDLRVQMKRVDAAQISDIVNGCNSLFPIAGVVFADSLFGCFSVIIFSSIVSLAAGYNSVNFNGDLTLRPSEGETASRLQLGVLYSSLTLASIGLPGQAFHHGHDGFLNHAALKIEGDIGPDGSIAKPWRLCMVEQVEDLKTLLRIFPLWSSGIFISVPIEIQMRFTVLQALTMDRHIGPHFQIPVGSFLVFTFVSTAIAISISDRFLPSTWSKLTGGSLTPLQGIGLGHVLNIISMASFALMESRWLHVFQSHHLEDQTGSTIVPMSALWLAVPLAIVGVSLYYQEFPGPLRSIATAMVSLLLATGFYMSTTVVDLIRRVTGWLPDNINQGRMDNLFWMLVVIGAANFGYYLVCANLYKYQNVGSDSENQEVQDED
ncbi:hypothetical protein NE237_008487 [Protea cynaroides]|uniref:Uncharacterized protein n=1 Tax=Protea cynaroides TaxID=273540 RepID=A0A9Q0KVP8_9MAGN|nr:hypothetical protein NE237_008487 [Protea cynaroides]